MESGGVRPTLSSRRGGGVSTNNGLIQNVSANLTADIKVSREFTPRSFAAEIELIDETEE